MFRNESGLDFTDISSECWREYVFANAIVRIDSPLMLCVTKNGHRVFDAAGTSHYVPAGWVHLAWRVKDDAPHFVL